MRQKIQGQFCNTPKGDMFGVKLGVYGTLEVQENTWGKLSIPIDYQEQLEKQYTGEWDCFEIIAKKGADGKWFYNSDYGRSDDIIQLGKGFESTHDFCSATEEA